MNYKHIVETFPSTLFTVVIFQNDDECFKTFNNLRKAEWTLIENHVKILLNKEELLGALPRPPMKDYDIPHDLAMEYNLLNFTPFLNFLQNESKHAFYYYMPID